MTDIGVHATPYGRPAAQLLRDRVAAAKRDDPLRLVTVVVPTNYVGVSARRLLAGDALGAVTNKGRGVAGLTLLTVYRLAELLGAPRLAASGRRPVSTPIIAAAARQVLADDAGIFAPVREHPSTEEALLRAHRELSELRPASLGRLAARSARAAEVVRIHNAVRARLEGAWYLEADLMAAAAQAIGERAPVLEDLGTVLLYLPQDLSLPAARLLRALGSAVPLAVIAGRTGASDADADVERALRRLGVVAPTPDGPPPPTATAVASVSDAEEEVRTAVARVIAAARDGVALERMAVVYPTPQPYARLLSEHLDAAGIAYNGRAVRPLADRMLGRWLLDLLDLPDQRYARPRMMGLISAAPVVDSDGRWVAAGAWERVSREAGIVAGRDEWLGKLARFADEVRVRADLEDTAEVPREWLAERYRRDADHALDLSAFVAELCDRLGAARRLSRWHELVGWCQRAVRRYLGGDREREGWPQVERDAADRVDEALDRLAGLGEVEARTDLAVFRRTLQLTLDDDLGKVGAFGEGVLLGTASAVLGVDLDLVVVLGLAEGVFPTHAREDSLLPDSERMAAPDELRLRGDRVGVEHRHLLAALAASGGQRVLVYPRGDLRRSVERAPSRWLLDSVEALRGDGERVLPARADWLEEVPSFAARVRTATFPTTAQEYRLRVLDGQPAHRRLLRHPLVNDDDALRLGVELALTRGRGFSRFDGDLGTLAEHIASPTHGERVLSASQLEKWLSCPHAYFMDAVLRVRPVENPEELLEMDPLEKGGLVHDVLERWLREQLDARAPAPGDAWPRHARERLRAIAEEACDSAEARGVTGHPLLWRRDRERLLLDFDRFLHHDDARRAALRATPVAVELPFGVPGVGNPAATIDLGDGRSLRLRGRIDRVDRTADGTTVVTDYKTGGTSRYKTLTEAQPLGDGTKLQLAIYGLALRTTDSVLGPIRTEYWFTSTRGDFKRIGYGLGDDVVAALRTALRVAVDGIAAGQFPLKPPEPGWSPFTECRYCDPDDLGTADRYRDWERILQAAALRGYVGYIAPDALAPEVAVSAPSLSATASGHRGARTGAGQ